MCKSSGILFSCRANQNNEICRKKGGMGENIILNEVTQVLKDKHCFFALTHRASLLIVVTAFMWA